ncbi:MAG: TIM barrel protein [Acidimicrobiia bacterium]|nr:MAG: TIM barrel protein [Acidimicrobiia bacterium]
MAPTERSNPEYEAAASETFDLAVCSEMVFLDLPFEERLRRLDDLGFQVEIWDWTQKDIGALVRTGATFSSMTGYLRGGLAERDASAEMLRTAGEAIPVAKELGCPRLVVHGTQLDGSGRAVRPVSEVTGSMWLNAARTLDELAELGESNGVTFCLENLNVLVDHPGVPFARAADTLALVEATDRPGVRMMLDLYHAQIGEGNLVELVHRAGSAIGEVQVADVPGRCEPGTGELNYPAIASALGDIGYSGVVGLEAYAAGDDVVALERFRAAFTL